MAKQDLEKMGGEERMDELAEKMSLDLVWCHTEINLGGNIYTDYVETARKMVAKGYRKLPTGKWIMEREPNGMVYCFSCSFCYEESETMTKFCPHCGAKMALED